MGQITLSRVRGRNGFDPPLLIPDEQVQELVNIDLYEGQLGKKRRGTSAEDMTFSAGGPFTTPIVAQVRHVPGASEAAMEKFSFTATVVGRKAASAQYAAVTVKDAITAGTAGGIMGVSFNGKLFLAGYDSAVNRAQVWDGSTIRRVGVGTPAAPTGADMGAGVLSFARSYKVAYAVLSGSVTLRESELGPVLTRTIAAKLGSTITKPASISEGETHWKLYASDTATGVYYLIATTAVGTTTFDDTNATIPATTAAPVAGTNTPPPSAMFVACDGNRLLYYGALETAAGDSAEPKNGRVWFAAVLGASATSIGDDERIPIQSTAGGLRYYIDIGENTGGEPRGLAGPLDGSMFAFQSNGITELAPSGRPNTPYRRFQINTPHGAVGQKSIVHAPDAAGAPCIYFLSPFDGPRRIGRNGIEWIGADIKDVWDRVNLDASVVAHGVYHRELNQIWWWLAIDGSASPNILAIFDISEGVMGTADSEPAIRYGWGLYSGDLASAWSSVMFSVTPGATMARRLKPYAGTTNNNEVLKCDTGTATCQAYLDTKPYPIGELTHHGEVTGASIVAPVATGVPIQLTVTRDYGAQSIDSAVTLTAEGTETDAVRKFPECGLGEAKTVQFRLGDAASIANAWTLDQLTVTTKGQEAFLP